MQAMTKSQAKQLSPLTLAFYGDCVYELLVRQRIVKKGSRPSKELHRMAVEQVRASFQSAAYDRVLPMLTEEEADIIRRGRNATGLNPPKSSSARDYHRATAVEALFGYLSLIGENARLEELFEVIIDEEADEKGAD